MNEQPTTVVFSLTSAEPRAWVCVSGQDPRPQVMEMWQMRPGTWSACVALSPGDYRCRCYVGDGRTATYCGPATVDGGVVDGMDAVFKVRGDTVPGRADDADGWPPPFSIPGVGSIATVGRAAEDRFADAVRYVR